MVIILLLVLLMCLSSSSMYGFGFIPGTGSYAKKELQLSKLSLKRLDETCAAVKKFDKRDATYFTLGGMKSLEDLFSDDDKKKLQGIHDVCQLRDEGNIVTFDTFKEVVQGYDTAECEKIKTTMSEYQTKMIVDDGKLISHVDAYEKIYPKSIERCYKT